MRLSDTPPLAVLMLVGAYAGWARMQTLLIIVLLLILVLFYRGFVLRFVQLGLRFLTRVDQARFKDLELKSERQSQMLTELERKQVGVVHGALLLEMDTQAVAVLTSIAQKGRGPYPSAWQSTVRYLRDRGLVEHDQTKLRDSSEVWLSETGRDLVGKLQELRASTAGTPTAAAP